jgi:hypothetical protein
MKTRVGKSPLPTKSGRCCALKSKRRGIGFVNLLTIAVLICTSSFSHVSIAAASASAEIVNDRLWLDPNDIVHVLGEVKNTGDVWLSDVIITAAMWNPDGLTVGTISGPASAVFLPPNRSVPFDIARATITTTDQEMIPTKHTAIIQSWTVLRGEVPIRLATVNVQHEENALQLFQVTGQVENLGDMPSRITRVIGTFYEAGGDVVYVTSTPTTPETIPPGTKSEQFRLTVTDEAASKRVTNYAIIAESQDYTSVPETPLPTFFAPMAVAVTLLALSKKLRDIRADLGLECGGDVARERSSLHSYAMPACEC